MSSLLPTLLILAIIFVIVGIGIWHPLVRSRKPHSFFDCKKDDIVPAVASSIVRIGIVVVTKQPIAFETWLSYHMKLVGVQHFFVSVEDTPELVRLLATDQWKENVTVHASTGDVTSYFTLMERQEKHVNRSVEEARSMGLTHLIHVDDDELVYLPNGRALFERHLSRRRSDDYSYFHMTNLEAVYDRSECVDPFRSVQYFNTTPETFSAYTNGKSIGILADGSLRAHGPHAFTGDALQLPVCVAVVLHYESFCVERWRKKFLAYATDSPDACANKKIPFQFYCDSIEAFKTGRNDEHDVWTRWKTRTRHDQRALVKIDIGMDT